MNLNQFNRILLQTLLLPVLALALVAGILVWQIRSAQHTVTAIEATSDSIAAETRAEKLLIDQETGLRGYQITGDPQFLQPYNEAVAPLRDSLAVLRQNLIRQKEDPHPVDSIAEAYETWRTGFAQPIIATLSGGGNITGLEQNLDGKRRMDALRARLLTISDLEGDIRTREIKRFRYQVGRTIVLLIILALSAGVFVGVFTVSRLRRVSEVYQGTLDGLRRHAQVTYESEERLRTTLTSIGDGVIVCDAEGNVEMLNTVAQQLTGFTQAEALHKPLIDIFHIVNETSRELVETPVAKVLRLKRVVGLANHTVLIRRDGTELNIDDSGAPIHDRTGALTGIVMVFRDITEQRHTQSALLATEKLATAGRLAATIAHEMHNPLDSVVNLLYLIRDEKDPATSSHYLDLAQQELGRMGQVTRAMLGLYRESKAPVRIDVKDMLESVLVLLDRQMQKSQVAITTNLSDRLEIEGFPAELRQVFTNLLANAAEACAPSGRITLEARSSAPGRPGVIVTVSDTGSGIDRETLEHMFTPFFTTKGEHGTGLGLWVSRGIIDKHGGTIDIASRTTPEDHGTTLTIFLPRVAATVPPTALEPPT